MITVKVIECRTKGFMPLAWLIMLFQGMNPFKRSSYNHMAIAYIDEDEVQKIADSTLTHGFKDGQPLDEWTDRYHITGCTSVEINYPTADFLEWLKSHRGKDYDHMGVLGLAGKLLYIFQRNPWGSDFKRMMCNELILSMVKRFRGVVVGDPDDYDLLMTADLVRGL